MMEINFLLRVAGFSLRDKMRSLAIWERLRVEQLLLHIKRSYLRCLMWSGAPERFPVKVCHTCSSGRRLWGRPRTCWRDCISRLAWKHLEILWEELEEVAGERDIWILYIT